MDQPLDRALLQPNWVLNSSIGIVYKFNDICLACSIWMLLWFVLKASECNLICFLILGTTTKCALIMFRNSVTLEKDFEKVNFIKMWFQGIGDCA